MKLEYIIGNNSIIEAFKANIVVKEIYIDKKKENKLNLLIKNYINKFKIPIILKNKQYLDSLIKNDLHQGIIGVMNSFKYQSLEKILNKNNIKKGFFIILDHIEDPYNFGSIIRTAFCGGVTGIIIPKNRAVKVNSTVIKVSSGAVFHIPIIQVKNLIQTITSLKNSGYWIYGSSQNGNKNFFNIKLTNPIVLIVGNEKKGISSLVLKNCDDLIKIPQKKIFDSLNVSVASGLLIYKIFENNFKNND